MFELPTSIEIDGTMYPIRNKADYRVIIDCYLALDDVEMTKEERIYSALIIFYEDINDISDIGVIFGDNLVEAVEKMFNFFNFNQPEYNTPTNNYHLIDWEGDSMLISSAVNHVAGKEVRGESYIHWWTFMGYYMAVGECTLATVVGIRYKTAMGKKLEKHEQKFKAENPQYFQVDVRTREQREADAYIRSIWNKQ